MDFDPPSGGPDRATIDAQLIACNEGTTVSGGWVDETGRDGVALAVGETNTMEDDGGEFPGACTSPERGDYLKPTARWMWFDSDTSDARSAFSAGDTGEFLIFRVRVRTVIDLI